MYSSILLEVGSLLTIILVGCIFKKRGIICADTEKGLGGLVLNLCMPCLLISSLSTTNLTATEGLLGQLLLITGATYLFLFLGGYVGTWLFRFPKDRRKYFVLLMLFNNIANIGYPVMSTLFGASGILYATFSNLAFMILLWTLGRFLLSNKKQKFSWKLFLTPGLISILIGYGLFFLQISLPAFLLLTLEKLGSLTGPLAMIVVGCSLANQKIWDILTNKILLKFVLIKQLLLPVGMFFLFRMIFGESDIIFIAVILASMPTAVNLVAFVQEQKEDSALAAQAVISSTLVSLPMVPILLWFMRLF